MHRTVLLDDALLLRARELSGLAADDALLNEALRALIQRQSARSLIGLGGTEPELRPIPRRRPHEAA